MTRRYWQRRAQFISRQTANRSRSKNKQRTPAGAGRRGAVGIRIRISLSAGRAFVGTSRIRFARWPIMNSPPPTSSTRSGRAGRVDGDAPARPPRRQSLIGPKASIIGRAAPTDLPPGARLPSSDGAVSRYVQRCSRQRQTQSSARAKVCRRASSEQRARSARGLSNGRRRRCCRGRRTRSLYNNKRRGARPP